MRLSGVVDRATLLAVGLLILFTPVVLLSITLGFLIVAEGLVFGELSYIEVLELYLIELALFAGFGYLLYRLLLFSVEHHLPELFDRLGEPTESPDPATAEENSRQAVSDENGTDNR